MPNLFIVGGGLFGSQAARQARSLGIETFVFDSGLAGAASPAAAGLFKEQWAGKTLGPVFHDAVALLDQHFGVRGVELLGPDGTAEHFHFVPPSAILDPAPLRQTVSAVGDGWLEADGQRHEGWIYIAAGIWSGRFAADLQIRGKAGTSLIFAGERPGRIEQIAYGRQAISFVRDAGTTFFSDGTAERDYREEHDRQTLARAAVMGLTDAPLVRQHGYRPYTPGGPVFRRLGQRTWLATGARKMGTLLGAVFARRLLEEMRQR